jgi:hypothetical protein
VSWDLWVDFNDLERPDRLTAFADRARSGVNLRRGALITVGKGGVARAVVDKRGYWSHRGRLVLRLVGGTLRFDGCQ